MEFRITLDTKYVIPAERFNNLSWIEERMRRPAVEDRGALKTLLTYLYMDDGPINLPYDRLKKAQGYLDLAEKIVVRWKFTQTNGSERANYGPTAGIEAWNARYRCRQCKCPYVRVLEMDHVNGRAADKLEFSCLCSNCHKIKSRAKNWCQPIENLTISPQNGESQTL